MIRVLYIARAPFVSGAERALMTQLRHLDRERVDPAVVLGHDTALGSQIRDLDIPVERVALPKRSRRALPGWWRSLWRLRRVIRHHRPDILHANDVPSCQAMSRLGEAMGLPRVVHVRWGITAGDLGWWAYRGAEVVLCISAWVRGQIGEVAGTPVADSRLEVLHDAVDWPAQSGTGDPPRREPAPEDAGDAGRALVLGFTGQLIPSKGLDLVIEAMGHLPTPRQPRLLVAGEDTQAGGAYRAKLQELAASCGVADRIRWLGFVEDVGQVHRQADVMVCPSRLEPLGLVPLEAARAGCPTLANRVGGLAETIEHGRTGWLADPTVQAWTEALAALPDRAGLAAAGAAARDHTRRRHGPQAYQERLVALYGGLLTGR